MMDTSNRVALAEEKIQKILLDLEEETALQIDSVDVDTRQFGNCAVEIFLRKRKSA